MFEKVLSKKTKQNLAILSQMPFMKGFYLAAGTGLALQLGHRQSLDLDFFSLKNFRPELIASELRRAGNFSLKSKAWGTLHSDFNTTKITFLYYPYPLLFKPREFLNIKVANYLDIACMKLDAVSTRGSKKDFVDLYFICQKMDLKKFFKLFAKKYKSVDFNLIHILKSLSYFEEAEKEPLPKMFKKISWRKIKNFFIKEAKNFKTEILE